MSMYPPENLLDGRYFVEKRIGGGHFAEVYLARDDRSEGEMVALKISKGSYGNQEKENEFLREAKHLFNLRHEHIIRLLDYTILDHKPLLVMEYMPCTLQEKYQSEGRLQRSLPPEEVLSYLQQAASALQFAHNHDIVHQDIKPANLLLDNDGLLKVSDFNISVLMQDTAVSKKLGGTEGYMAPEGYISPAADQYALGIVVYEGLLGHKPGFWISPRSLISRLFPASPVSAVLPVVLQALSKDPAKRFSDVQTFANKFEEAYKQAPYQASKRLKRMFIVGLTACLLVLVSLGLLWPSLSRIVSSNTELYRQATSGTPAINSVLSGQDSNEWQITTGSTGACQFTDDAYQVSTRQSQTDMACMEQAKTCKNCAFQVDLKIVNGDYGGVIVRGDPIQKKGYYFLISPEHNYKFGISDGQTSPSFLPPGYAPAIYGANQWNQVTLIALGNKLSFYINQQYVGEVSDQAFSQGMVGMVAEGLSNPAQVMFRNARLWSLS